MSTPQTYRAFRIHQNEGKHSAGIEQLELTTPKESEVVISVHYSSVNYKDALAGTGKGQILRTFPLTGGIDACGEIAQSNDPRFQPGDLVLVTGYGLSMTHDGGYADYLTVPADWVISLPETLGPFEAMALGTAGFTAGLAIQRMETMGLTPDQGPVVVTGASGGVGCLAVSMLAQTGYEVTAVTGKAYQRDFLKKLGAQKTIGRDEMPTGNRPLEKSLWAGAIDSVGGEMLSALTRSMKPWASIASIGMAGGLELNTTVMPFIIRGVNLLGINSSGCQHELRQLVWNRLAAELRPRHFEDIVDRVISLEELPRVFEQMMLGETRGRTLVDLRRD